MYLTMARILRVGPIIIRPNKDMIQYADTRMPSKEFILRLQLICVISVRNLDPWLNKSYDGGNNNPREW